MDVIERIQAEHEIAEGKRIFEDLFDNSDAAIIDYDFSALFRAVQNLKRDGVRDLRSYIADSDERLDKLVGMVRINTANAAALRMIGVTSLQELGKELTNIVDIAEAIFQGETRIRRSEYLVAGGTPIPVVYSLRIPRTEEEARRIPIVIMDLSDIKLAEAARQATIAKSQFLSSMSHEIRTPLNGVIGNLELLAQTTLDNEQFELIDDADKAAKSLLALIGNILDFSKIEAGKLTTEIGDINPAALVEEAVDVLQSRARQKKIFITVIIGPDVPILVRGDAMRVRQILLNLIGNAVKFTSQGGVQVKLTVTAWDQEVCELRFDVHDSGRGFDKVQGARLFQPFTQVGDTVHAEEGTGLGLSICKSLVEVFGGTIGCEGEPGEGATFWFTMPVTAVGRAVAVVRPDLAGKTVIVIGGADGVDTSLESYFKSRGASVIREAQRTALAFALEYGTDPNPALDVAVIIPNSDDADSSEIVRHMRERHIVPILYATDRTAQAERTALRQGFAVVIQMEPSTERLDRNIRLLMGHAQTRDRRAEQQAAVVSAFGPSLRGKQVLVLEDRLVNQTVIQKQLKKLGIDCALATNGLKGLEMLDRQDFDLILCDCSMPEMNGYDFTRVLRTREMKAKGHRHMPVIALTANAFREDADKCAEAGMDDFISKPVTMDRLAAMLVRWLNPVALASNAATELSMDEPDADACIDTDALGEILGTHQSDIINEVLAEFLLPVGTSLIDVGVAIADGNVDRIKAAAHGAKGEALSAAAVGLGALYADLEHNAKNGNTRLNQDLLSRATHEVARIEDFIRGRLGAQA